MNEHDIDCQVILPNSNYNDPVKAQQAANNFIELFRNIGLFLLLPITAEFTILGGIYYANYRWGYVASLIAAIVAMGAHIIAIVICSWKENDVTSQIIGGYGLITLIFLIYQFLQHVPAAF